MKARLVTGPKPEGLEKPNDMELYNDLITAKVILDKVRVALHSVEGDSPARATLLRATTYLNK